MNLLVQHASDAHHLKKKVNKSIESRFLTNNNNKQPDRNGDEKREPHQTEVGDDGEGFVGGLLDDESSSGPPPGLLVFVLFAPGYGLNR